MTAAPLRVLPERARPRPVSEDAPVLENRGIGDRYHLLAVESRHIAETARAGQFVMLTVTPDLRRGPVLPRPMAVYDVDPASGRVEIVYSVAGEGTRALAAYAPGATIGLVGPLGAGFQLPGAPGAGPQLPVPHDAGTELPGSAATAGPGTPPRPGAPAQRGTPPRPGAGPLLLIGRGIGTCSMTLLAARAAAGGVPVVAVASGRHPGAIVGTDFYAEHGVTCLPVHDEDGSSDPATLESRLHGLLDRRPPALVAACGSARLEALALRLGESWDAQVQVALEAHMACGLGYCHGCSSGARDASAEAPLICKDGPVFALR